MSQVYQVRLSSCITHTLRAFDRMKHRVELTDILDEDTMNDILREVLKAEGWDEGEDGTFTKKGPNGEDLVWDLEAGEVNATIKVEKEVAADLASTGYGESDAQAKADAQRAIERQKERAKGQFDQSESELSREVTESLSASEQERLRELNRVLQRVYSEALKRRAEELGAVVSVDEQQVGDDYELVIRISE